MYSRFHTCVVMATLCVLALGLRPTHGGDPEKKAPSEATSSLARHPCLLDHVLPPASAGGFSILTSGPVFGVHYTPRQQRNDAGAYP